MKKENLNVDDFVLYGMKDDKNEKYARWVLHHFRLKPIVRVAFAKIMEDKLLFCECNGKKYKVSGAGWHGKIWLAHINSKKPGYDMAVYVNECSNWSDK